MANNEKSLVNELKDDFFEQHPGGFWRKIHGDQFQRDLPDVLVATDAMAAFVEAKWVRDEAKIMAPLAGCASSLLTPMQRHTLTYLSAIDGPLRARMVIGMSVEADGLYGGEGTLCVGFDLDALDHLDKKWTLMRIAEIWLNGKLGNGWADTPPSVEAQLRCHGETWRSGALCLGLTRWVKEHERYDA